MAQCAQSAREFIQNSFGPMVAVLCSHDAEVLAQKNNLTFVEMARPFCRLTTEAHIRDPQGQVNSIRNLRVILNDMNSQPPSSAIVRKMLNDVVGSLHPNSEASKSNVVSAGNYDLQLSGSTPWFEAYREHFLQVTLPSEHEFIRHFIACMLVVSSNHADPIDQFSKLNQQQHQLQHSSSANNPKWLCPNIFKYYILLHDNTEGEEEKAEAVYQSMKSTYGSHACHLLRINSRSIQAAEVASMGNEYTANMPDPWSQFMTSSVEAGESGEMDISPSVDNGGFPDKVTETDPEHINDPTQPAEPLPIEDDSPVDPMPDTNPPHPLSQTNEVVSHPLDDQSAQTQMIITRDPDDKPDANNVDIVLKKLVGVHGACLTLSDHDRLRIFIHEFVVRGLLPYIEKMIRTLSEQLASRKGISRSFISATKNWFGGKRNAEKANKSQVDMGGKYLRESPELQMRRLGDLAFLVQMYELAYTSFHTAKRDFNNDHAYMHCAGALEMAATSAFMMGNLNKVYPSHYMDSAVSMYANTCKKPSFATRAILLSTETLKARGLYGEAAMEFIRMTGEDSDLRSALFLEQGAHCFINMKTPMARKYAFHMILAGHRYSKAGQRKHALRSYCQALQVYKGKGWTLAEDHINFTIGRQSFNLKQLDNASAAFKHLLTTDSRQPAVQQAAFLREYLFVFQQQMTTDGKALSPGLPQLPLPIINKLATKVLLGSTIRPILPDNKIAATSVAFNQLYDSAETDKWFELEEMVVKVANKSALATLRPSQKLLNGRTNNSQRPVAVIREPITIELVLTNPLKVPLLLCNLCLLWRFTKLDYEKVNDETPEKPPTIISNENIYASPKMNIVNEVIHTQTIPEFELKANEIKAVQLSLTPQQTGELSILGIMYSLSTPMQSTSSTSVTDSPSLKHSKKMGSNVVSVRGRQEVDVQGPRLNGTLMEKRVVTYGPDRRLDPIIAPPMPLLEACFIDFPYSLLCGEIGQTILEVSNKGDYPLHKLYIVSKQPQCFAFRSPNNSHVNADIQSGSLYRTIPLDNRGDVDEHVVDIQNLSCVVKVPLPEGHLKPGCSASIPMWIQGPEKAGIHDVDILFYYESTEENFKMRHRVLRHSAVINTTHSLCLKATATRGHIPEHNQGNQSLVVSLQVENMNQVHDTNITEFSVEQVTCVSKTWALEHIATKEKQEFKISGGESVICCLKAQHCKQIGQLDANQVVFTDGVLGKEKIMSFESPCSDFYFRSKLKLNELNELEPQEVSHTSQNNEGTSLKQLLGGALEVDLTLLVLWKAFVVDEAGISHKFVGQHHVTMAMLDQQISTIPTAQRMVEQKAVRFLKDVDVSNSAEPSSAVMIQLIKCSLQHPDHKEHDFTRKRLCTVPVTLHLCNCADMQLSVQVDTDTAQDNTSSDSSSGYYVTPKPPNSSDFVWVRRVSQQVTLARETSHQIQLLACFSKPGVFNLSNIKVKVSRQSLGMQGEYIEQKKLLPSVITVSKTINNLKSSLAP